MSATLYLEEILNFWLQLRVAYYNTCARVRTIASILRYLHVLCRQHWLDEINEEEEIKISKNIILIISVEKLSQD